MPIVLAVNGIVETYPINPAAPRHARVESVEAQGEDSQRRPSSDRSLLAAQTAYQQQTNRDRHPKPALLAGDLMTSPVLSLPSDHTVIEAWVMMTRKGFRHIPVTSMHGTVVGMVSDRDPLHHVPELVTGVNAGQAAQRRLGEIMTSRVISATPTTDIRDIARVMLDEHIHAVPVLGGKRSLLGIANHNPIELWT